MKSKKFQKRKENFVCENCGESVMGDGYTNHCPHCLWSKHVDINPGDRLETCGGMMEPIKLESKGDAFVIIHKCSKCGFQRKNKVCVNDIFDNVIKIGK